MLLKTEAYLFNSRNLLLRYIGNPDSSFWFTRMKQDFD